jgi:hypothetical protein
LKNFGSLLVNIKGNLKEYITHEIDKFLKNFDAELKYKGVSFPKVTNDVGLFKKK